MASSACRWIFPAKRSLSRIWTRLHPPTRHPSTPPFAVLAQGHQGTSQYRYSAVQRADMHNSPVMAMLNRNKIFYTIATLPGVHW